MEIGVGLAWVMAEVCMNDTIHHDHAGGLHPQGEHGDNVNLGKTVQILTESNLDPNLNRVLHCI